jgi:hypothetical protein
LNGSDTILSILSNIFFQFESIPQVLRYGICETIYHEAFLHRECRRGWRHDQPL